MNANSQPLGPLRRALLAAGLAVGLAAGLTALVPAAPASAQRPGTRAGATRAAPREGRPAPGSSIFANPPTVETLPNGLTVVSVPWESPGIIAYYTLVRVGSRDEVEQGRSGFAHLFEHMMFRGTQAVPQAQYEAALQAVGADNNAYTTQDFTLYTLTGPSSALARFVELEADRFQHLSYSEEVFRTETGAVRGEYSVNASNPFLNMWEALSESAFSRHTYGHTTLGYLRDIEAMPGLFEHSRSFFQRFYTPDNCTVIVAGEVDHAALMAEVRQRYGAWTGHRDQPRIPAEAEPREGARRDLSWEGQTQPRLFVGYRVPSFEGSGRTTRQRDAAIRETAALQVVHGLAFHESSPLYQRLVVSERRLDRLSSWAGELSRDPHLFVATGSLTGGRDFDPVIDAVQAELDRIGRGEVAAERVHAVQSHLRYAMPMGIQTPNDAAELVAQTLAVSGRLEALDEYVAALAAVTPEEVARAASRYLNSRRRFVVTLAPQETSAESPSSEPSQAESDSEGSSQAESNSESEDES